MDLVFCLDIIVLEKKFTAMTYCTLYIQYVIFAFSCIWCFIIYISLNRLHVVAQLMLYLLVWRPADQPQTVCAPFWESHSKRLEESHQDGWSHAKVRRIFIWINDQKAIHQYSEYCFVALHNIIIRQHQSCDVTHPSWI